MQHQIETLKAELLDCESQELQHQITIAISRCKAYPHLKGLQCCLEQINKDLFEKKLTAPQLEEIQILLARINRLFK